MTAVEFDVKQSKIQEFADLLKQRENAVQKQNFSLELTEYETQLIEAPYESWLLISTILQSSEIEDDIYEDFLLNPENYTTSNGEIIYNENLEADLAAKRQAEFEADFFEIPEVEGVFEGGYYRKTPKGYSSAIESINTAFNAVTVMGSLPSGYLTFYIKPDYTSAEECSEDWLVENQFKNEELTAAQFAQLYAAFVTAWNEQEHL